MPWDRRFRDTASWPLQYEVRQLEEYAEETERFLLGQRDSFDRWVDELADGGSDEVRDQIYDHYSDRYQQLARDFPQTLRYSTLVAVQSQVEHFLTERCHALQRSKGLPLGLADLRDKGTLRTASAYLKKVAGVRFPPDSSAEWGRIIYFSRLRNRIVHADGEVGTDTRGEKLRRQISADPLVELSSLDRIELSDKFIPNVIETIWRFLEELDGEGPGSTSASPPPVTAQ